MSRLPLQEISGPGFSRQQVLKIESHHAIVMIARDIVRRHFLNTGESMARLLKPIVMQICMRLMHFDESLAEAVATEAVIMCQI